VLAAGGGLRERLSGRGEQRKPRRNVKRALADLERAGRDAASKEAAAATIERTLHAVFGSLDGDAANEGERAAQAVMDEVHYLRFAPQLGDYSERIHAVARRAADVVRRFG